MATAQQMPQELHREAQILYVADPHVTLPSCRPGPWCLGHCITTPYPGVSGYLVISETMKGTKNVSGFNCQSILKVFPLYTSNLLPTPRVKGFSFPFYTL